MGFKAGVNIFLVCSCYYFFLEDDSTVSTQVSYILWTALMCLLIGLVAGFSAFAGSFYFVRRIYTKAQAQKAR